jgi:hypothetical protein
VGGKERVKQRRAMNSSRRGSGTEDQVGDMAVEGKVVAIDVLLYMSLGLDAQTAAAVAVQRQRTCGRRAPASQRQYTYPYYIASMPSHVRFRRSRTIPAAG